MDNKRRCTWCNMKNPKYTDYHDNEWGVARFDDKHLFEMLILESFQAGLSWECVLNKRDAFRRAYLEFDVEKVSRFGEDEINRLLSDAGIIRNRRKISASIKNSIIFRRIAEEFGSFYNYLKTFVGDKTVYETGRVTSSLSDTISKDLVKRGMCFVGSTIIYSYLQAIGIIYAHDKECFLYKDGSDTPALT